MNIKPGDLFEWVYADDYTRPRKGAALYSDLTQEYFFCTNIYLCIGIKDGVIYWIFNNRILYTRLNSKQPWLSSLGATLRGEGRRVGTVLIPHRI